MDGHRVEKPSWVLRAVKARAVLGLALAALAAVPAGARADLDNPAPALAPQSPPSAAFMSGPPEAKWELVRTITTGNPHTDLDFFTKGGETFASVGTLAIGPNAGGQTLVQLTQGGQVNPRFVSSHPSAACVTDPEAATGLQHDVEATPKGNAPLNVDNPQAVRADAQLLIDATDAESRCHDQGTLGVVNAPQGGLEIIDITDPNRPQEIGLTSHIGEAHTVNVDPRRPHIAYAVSSDAIGVTADGKRENEDPADTDRSDLDGFEVVDLSSCMNFPAGTSIEEKRARCRPQIFRYRYPSAAIGLGHTLKTGQNALYGCHELEVYPDDRLACGGGNAAMLFDVSGAFDDRGTPNDFTDDKPRGTPLPCRVRPSSTTVATFATGAQVTDCVVGANDANLEIPGWLAIGAPSLTGVRHLGSAHHQGRGAGTTPATPAFDSTQDIDFDHELELTASGKFVIATDERGGGIAPPGATCATGADNTAGNGGMHAYAVDRLQTRPPGSAEEAHRAYARTLAGEKSIFRARVRTGVEPTVCTAHVFQQIPGQNRIFMGWYSQGTQVVDFIEYPDGRFEFKEAGFFIPANANEWVSHIFRVERNSDGTYTYWGTTGDFALSNRGRNSIDIYKATLPPPAQFVAGAGAAPTPACPSRTRSKRVRVRRDRRTTISVRVTRGGRVASRVKVRASGPGFRVSGRTDRSGRVKFRVRPRRSGRATVSSGVCAARLSVSVRTAQAPRFTG